MTNPTEKEWWYHEDSSIGRDHDGPIYDEKAVAKIVAEAERRTWEKVRRFAINSDHFVACPTPRAIIKRFLILIDAKLSSLTKK